jgi:hypothetical protein
VFAAFEMAALFGGLADLDEQTLKSLPDALRILIVTTLEETINLPVSGEDFRRRRIPPVRCRQVRPCYTAIGPANMEQGRTSRTDSLRLEAGGKAPERGTKYCRDRIFTATD